MENRLVIKKIKLLKSHENLIRDIKIKLYHNNTTLTSDIFWDYMNNQTINWKFIFDYNQKLPISFLILDDELFNTDNIIGQAEIKNIYIDELRSPNELFEFPEPLIDEIDIFKEKDLIGTMLIEQYLMPKELSQNYKCGIGWSLPDSYPTLNIFPLKRNNEIYQHIKIIDDKFGIEEQSKFDVYSEAFSRIIDEPENKPPLCFGIIGPDHYGKTNFLYNLKNKLLAKENNNHKHKNKYNPEKIIIEFNAWSFEADSTIWASLLEKKLGSMKIRWLRIKNYLFPETNMKAIIFFIIKILILLAMIILLIVYSSQLGSTISIICGIITAIITLSFVKNSFIIIKNIIFSISDEISKNIQKPDWSKKLDFMNDIKKEFIDFLNPIIKKYNIRLILMIDDLDRCSIEKVYIAIKSLSLLKNSDCPIYIFIVYDSIKIHEAINTYYKQKYQLTKYEGKQILDKLINIPFCLPEKNIVENLSLIEDYLDEEYFLNLRNELMKKIPALYKIYNNEIIDINKTLENYYSKKFPNKELPNKKNILQQINNIDIIATNDSITKTEEIIINLKEDHNDDKLMQIEQNIKNKEITLSQLENYYNYLIKIEKDYNNISRINEIKNLIYIKFIHIKKDFTNNYYIGLDSEEIKTFQKIIEDTKGSSIIMNNYQVKKIINIYSIARFILPKFLQNKRTVLFHLIVITELWLNLIIELILAIKLAKNNLNIQQIKDCFNKDLAIFYINNEKITKNDELMVYLSKYDIKVIDCIELEPYIFNLDRCLLNYKE